MRALVTGGCGFIGSHLVDRLLAGGYAVDVVDDFSSGRTTNLTSARADRNHELTIHRLDVRAAELVELCARRRPQVVFHLAAPPWGRAADLAAVVVGGTANVLESAVAAGAGKVVMALSADLYGDLAGRDLPAKDTRELAPRSPRGLAEHAALDYLAAYRAEHALEFCGLTLASVYGTRRIDGVVASFARALVAGEPGRLNGNGSTTRDFVAVDDVVDAFVRAGERGTGLVVNVATGVETSISALHDLMASGVGVTKAPVRTDTPASGPVRMVLDPRRAEIYLGWRPFTTLGEGVAGVLRWWAAQSPPAGSTL